MITAVAVSGTGCSQTQPASIDYKTADKVADGAILQAFCWDFNTIKESMGDIAAAGFSAVQTSPINECLEGEDGGMDLYGNGKWYYHYQPTDFKIGNYQLGTRDEFKAMCDEAHKYGVKVIVDVSIRYGLAYGYMRFPHVGFPIQRSPDQWIFAPPRSLSQLITSFFGP